MITTIGLLITHLLCALVGAVIALAVYINHENRKAGIGNGN